MNKPRTSTDAVEAAVKYFGNVAARLAEAIDVSPQSVSFWREGERRVPADKCPLIERVTGGAVTCEELRPDVAWDVLRMQAGEPGVKPRAPSDHPAQRATDTTPATR